MSIDANGFDRDYYLARNPDVVAAGIDPYQHYLQFGWREGRNPNLIFDTRYYLAANPDVAAAGGDPLAHYLAFGWREGRDPSVAFDTGDYLAANADVAAAHVNPMLHYLRFGQYEHRALTYDTASELREGFDRAYYLAANPDVAAAGIDPYVHYEAFGRAEGRRPNALFDQTFYLAHNPDVAAAGGDPFQHFLAFGWREGRDPSADFSLSRYRAAAGTPAGQDPLIAYLATDRYSGIPSPIGSARLPQIIQARGSPLSAIVAGGATLAVDGPLIHVTAPSSPLDGHDLSGFTNLALSRSSADIAISGSGRLPLLIQLGTGDDRLAGTFDLGGQILNFSAGPGTLTTDVRFDDGTAAVSGGDAGSDVVVRGTAATLFTGGAGPDIVRLGDGNDDLSGGLGRNRLDGGGGIDRASWGVGVRADLQSGHAASIGSSAIDDTLTNIENLGGSPFDDVLLGDSGANRIDDVSLSPGASGHDILAGRGGDDVLWACDGDDILLGGRGADMLIGGEGDDLLVDAADGWGAAAAVPTAYGGDGDDRLVFLLGAPGDPNRGNFMAGGEGTDIYVIDPSQGRWGSLGIEFSQIDGDRLDLSALRSAAGGTLTLADVEAAASNPFNGSTTIDLGAFRDGGGNALGGRLTLNGVFAAGDLRAGDFIFAGGQDWRTMVPSDLVALA